jgi:hypothetical protein
MKKESKRVKKTRRSQSKYPALDPTFMPKVRREYLDMDYISSLSEDEKAWLNKFIEEELNASFKNTRKDFNRTKAQKKAIYHKNNARNRCLYGIAKVTGNLKEIVIYDKDIKITNPDLVEDALIAAIDDKAKKP